MEQSLNHLPAIVKSLDDVIQQIEQNRQLSATTRRDLLSDVRTTAKLIGRHPCEIATDVPTLRSELRQVSVGVAGITAKRFTNIRSNLARALRLARILPRQRPRSELSADWAVIWEGTQERSSKTRLSRLINYCAARRVEPDKVDDDLVVAFRNHLNATSLYQDPKKVSDDAARAWNRVTVEQRLSVPTLKVSKAGRYVTRRLTDYPATFQEDFASYKNVLIRADYFAEKGPIKPLRPASLVKIEADVRQVLNAAVEAGWEIDRFKQLADLVSEPVIEAAFGWLTERNGGEYPTGLKEMAATLLAIAKHHVELPEDNLRRLRAMRSKVTTYHEGMSDKNRRRLVQFDNWKNTAALVTLPDRLLTRAKATPGNVIAATDALYATAITLLLACPMRMKNLAGLDLDKHILSFGRGANLRYKISVSGGEVKNGVAIDVELQEHASKAMTLYLHHFRHLLISKPTRAFFPSANGTARPPSSLGYGISNIISKETGLEVHPHLFRHLTAKLYLEAYHGDYESVRRQLGHKKYDTTLKFYASFDNKRAQERFSSVVLEAKKPKVRKR